jgi:hypothetical protein
MKTEHTQQLICKNGWYIELNGKCIATCDSTIGKRIAATFNACDGIPTEALENGVIKKVIKNLIEATKEILNSDMNHHMDYFIKSTLKDAEEMAKVINQEYINIIEQVKGRPFSELIQEE